MAVSFFLFIFAASNNLNSKIMKLTARFKLGSKLLKVYSTSKGLRGKLYRFTWNNGKQGKLEELNSADFLEADRDNTLYRVKEYFGMNSAKQVHSDKYINVNHRVIWTNNDYDEWEACMKEDYPDGVDEDGEEINIDYERYYEDCSTYLDDERGNLDKTVDGVIVCFADLGLWDGHHNGAKTFGDNVKNILSSSDDYLDWYCDRYNVRGTGIHHDGTNHYLYRVAKNQQQADDLVNEIAYGDMTEEEFRKATKSLRPYVAKVYGW